MEQSVAQTDTTQEFWEFWGNPKKREEPKSRIDSTSSDPLQDLIERCSRGDESAFLAVYKATSGTLFGVALRIVRQECCAEEVLQEGFLKIWRNAHQYDSSRGTPMTWMINVVRNLALDFLRSTRSRSMDGERIPEEELETTDDPLVTADNSIRLAQIRSCLGELPAQQQRCVLLIYHQGFTPTEVAGHLGVSVNTVKTWVRRSLQRIRCHLQECDTTTLSFKRF